MTEKELIERIDKLKNETRKLLLDMNYKNAKLGEFKKGVDAINELMNN